VKLVKKQFSFQHKHEYNGCIAGGNMSEDTVHYNGIEADKLDEEFDGITFCITGVKKEPKMDIWSLNFLKAPEAVEFQEKPLGFKYTICTMNENLDVSVFDAILGDPLEYVNNCMRAREMGVIAKTSDWGSKLVDVYKKIFSEGELQNV